MPLYCVRCGAPNEDLATTCSACGTKLISLATVGETAHAIDKAAKKPIGSILLLIICVIYLLNPFFGIDIIPDYIPIVGNLDEAGLTYLLLKAMSGLGWIAPPGRKQLPPTQRQALSDTHTPYNMR